MSVLKTYGDDKSIKPSRTYKLQDNIIEGVIDNIDAVKQSASLILSVDRFEHPIYSLDYGSELKDLIGKDRNYVRGDIKRRILESLKEDDRISGIKDFKISFEKEVANVSFTVISTFGEFNMERGITL